MIYYAIADVLGLSDIDTGILRERIKKHFIKSETLKRKESVAAKALLCMLLKQRYNLADFTVDCDENGKPFVVGNKVFFNLSHSGNFVMCAFGDENVGCDIQEIKDYNPKVAKRFFSQNEVVVLEKSDCQALAFTKMWTLKESVLKFSGEGVTGGLDRYDFSEYYNRESFTLSDVCFNSFEIPGYVISICSEKGNVLQLNAEI